MPAIGHIGPLPTVFNGHVPALDIAGFFQTLMECGQRVLRECVVGRIAGKEPDHRHRRLLRARRERPRRRAADERYELAPPHSITASARESSVGGISRPIALADGRWMP